MAHHGSAIITLITITILIIVDLTVNTATILTIEVVV
jgi:hypothetical protein